MILNFFSIKLIRQFRKDKNNFQKNKLSKILLKNINFQNPKVQLSLIHRGSAPLTWDGKPYNRISRSPTGDGSWIEQQLDPLFRRKLGYIKRY
jgi:hypothetical protein